MVDIPPIGDIIVFTALWIGILGVSSLVYREMYYRGALKERYIAKFDLMLSKTKVGKALLEISAIIKTTKSGIEEIKKSVTEIEIPEIPSAENLGKDVVSRIRGMLGGLKKGTNAEEKEVMEDLADLASIEYPGLQWVDQNLALLTELGMIPETWAPKFRNLSKYPQLLPTLEKIALGIKGKFESQKGLNKRSGDRNFW